MIHGLIMGRFDPLHKGHIDLIEYGASKCDKLNVLLCSCDKDSINGPIRMNWLIETFRTNKKINPILLEYIFAPSNMPKEEMIKEWSINIRKLSPTNDILFSGELYGNILSINLNCKHCLYDPLRSKYNISGTQIRENPQKYFNLIADSAKPYYKL